MNIQTAGEQKYFDFIQDYSGKLRTGMIVWISFLSVACIAASTNIVGGILPGIAGIGLAVRNVRLYRKMKSQMNCVRNKTEFYNQLISPETVEVREIKLLITKEYVLSCHKDVFVYPREDIKKIEVKEENKANKSRKYLILTDKNNQSHELAECLDAKSEPLVMRAYNVLINSN